MSTRVAILLVLVCSTAIAQTPVEVHPDQRALLESRDPQLAANKKLIFDFLREVYFARNMTLAPQFLAEGYVQHDPNVANGREAFVNHFGRLERRPVPATIDDLVTLLAERDLVVVVFRRELPDPKLPGKVYTTTWFEMFRVADGKIVEHWDDGTKRSN